MSQLLKVMLNDLVPGPANLMARPLPNPTDKDYATTKETWLNSIRTHGILNLFSVRKDGDKYAVIDGNTRLYFIKVAVAEGDPVISEMFADGINVQVTEKSDIEALASSVMANTVKRDMKPAHYGQSLHKLLALGDFTLDEISQQFSLSRQTIEKYLNLAKMPEAVRTALDDHSMSIANAVTLNKVPELMDDPEWVKKACNLDNAKLSVEVEEVVKAQKAAKTQEKTGHAPEFSPVAKQVTKDKLCELYEKAKFAYEQDASEYNRIRKEVFDEIFGLDELSIANQKASFEKQQAESAEKAKAREAKRLVEKKLETILNAIKAGITIPAEQVAQAITESGLPEDNKLIIELRSI